MTHNLTVSFRRLTSLALAAVGLALLAPLSVHAQEVPQSRKGELHGLSLGMKADEMDTEGFGEFHCGSNGGPPRAAIFDWSEFKKCRPEANGLYEVYVRFDDHAEYVGKALEDPTISTNRRGTRVGGHPVILSTLFDSEGVLRMIRFVSDPRGDIMERRMGHLLRLMAVNRYDPAGWNCKDIPPGPGESPVGGIFHHSMCLKEFPDKTIFVHGKFFRKPGQFDQDPNTREYTSGYFESSTRVEIYDPALKIER